MAEARPQRVHVTCSRCKHRQTLAEPKTDGVVVHLICHGCEQPLKIDLRTEGKRAER